MLSFYLFWLLSGEAIRDAISTVYNEQVADTDKSSDIDCSIFDDSQFESFNSTQSFDRPVYSSQATSRSEINNTSETTSRESPRTIEASISAEAEASAGVQTVTSDISESSAAERLIEAEKLDPVVERNFIKLWNHILTLSLPARSLQENIEVIFANI